MTRIAYLTTIDFGPGELKALEGAVGELGSSGRCWSPTRGLPRQGSSRRRWRFCRRGRRSSSMCRPIPRKARCTRRWRCTGRRSCDGIVAVGGGSPIDLAKGVALLATHEGHLEQYRADLWRAGADHGRGRAGDRRPDHRGHRRRGGPRGAADARRPAQGGGGFALSDPQTRHLRPGADLRPAAKG